MTKRLIRAAKLAVPLVIGFFIARAVYGNWQQVRDAHSSLSSSHLLASFLLASPPFLVRPQFWRIILRRFGYPISYREAFQAVRFSDLSRYTPGAVWQYVTRVYLVSRAGVPAAACLAATLLEVLLTCLAAFPAVLWDLDAVIPAVGRYHLLPTIGFPLAALAAMHPAMVNFWGRRMARWLRQPFHELAIGWLTLLGIWVVYIVLWALTALGAGLFVRGIVGIPAEAVPAAGNRYVAPWLIGTLSMISPAGLAFARACSASCWLAPCRSAWPSL